MIYKVKRKRTLALSHYILIFLTTLVVFAYLRSPENPKWDGVMPDERAQGAVISSGVAPALLARLVPHVELSKHETKSDAVVASAKDVPVLAPLSPYGMAAIGSEGAWDGHTENGQNTPFGTRISTSLRDHLGNPCILNTDKIPTQSLRAIVSPPSLMDDHCHYRERLIYREDALPADVLAYQPPLYMISSTEVQEYLRGGMWSTADFEALVRRGQAFGEIAMVNVYLILKQGNSPWAESLANRSDVSSGEKSNLKLLIQTGKCPYDDYDINQFCFPQK